jgi:integrase/recombinase XerD
METCFEEELKDFVRCMAAKGYNPSTQGEYAANTAKFFEWLEEKGIKDVRRVGKDTMQAYVLYLGQAKGKKGELIGYASICARIRGVKRFFEWQESIQKILVNPTESIREPKRPSRLPKFVLSQEEVEWLLAVPDITTGTGIRSKAILEVFYSTGIRLGEMTALKVEDVNLDEGLLRVNEGKGAKDRVVPLGEMAKSFLKQYLREVRPQLVRQGDTRGHLWMSNNGTPLSKMSVGIMVRLTGRAAGIEKPVSPHTLRHTFATHMVKSGADIILVSQLLGHSELGVTQLYVKVAGVDVKKAHEATHPREKDQVEKEHVEPFILWKRGAAHA